MSTAPVSNSPSVARETRSPSRPRLRATTTGQSAGRRAARIASASASRLRRAREAGL